MPTCFPEKHKSKEVETLNVEEKAAKCQIFDTQQMLFTQDGVLIATNLTPELNEIKERLPVGLLIW